jgi:hypothetical protein
MANVKNDLVVHDLDESKHSKTPDTPHHPTHCPPPQQIHPTHPGPGVVVVKEAKSEHDEEKIELPVLDDDDEPTEIKTCRLFISYQWKAQPRVKKLYAELANHESLEAFMDIYKIKAGMNLYASLATNLQQADIVLACVTRDYVKSKNCEREIIYADAFNKPIIPLFIEKIPNEEMGSIGFLLIRERFCNLYKYELSQKFKSLIRRKGIIGLFLFRNLETDELIVT